ncbi:hypothetical protein [Tropicibacter sp. S64]|uniref:hypothetical protein n=1 Tax=Tropicibacter sp. S64 TaxID=3415122 RepID=UPI003C7E65AE
MFDRLRTLTAATLALLVTATGAAAAGQDFQASVREAIRSGDATTASRTLGEADAAWRGGGLAAADHRALFRLFETADPRVRSLVSTLSEPAAATDPGVLGAIHFRQYLFAGKHLAYGTEQPDALATQASMLEQAVTAAAEAIAAGHPEAEMSDGLIYLAGEGYGAMLVDDILYRTLAFESDPDMLLAAMTARNKWIPRVPAAFEKADADLMETFCPRFGPMILAWAPNGTEVCQLHAAARHINYEPRDWFVETLAQVDRDEPTINALRRRAVIELWSDNPEWQADLQAYFDDPETRDYELAQLHDMMYAKRMGMPLAAPKVVPRIMEDFDARMAENPFDIDLMMTLRSLQFWTRESDEGARIVLEGASDPAYPDRRLTLARRELLAHPWAWKVWFEAANDNDLARSGKTFPVVGDMIATAIAYGGHNPSAMGTAMRMYNGWITWVDRSAEKGAPLDWSAEEREALLTCPYLHAARILTLQCQGYEDEVPCFQLKIEREIALLARLKAENACPAATSMPIEALGFSPVPVDLLALSGL